MEVRERPVYTAEKALRALANSSIVTALCGPIPPVFRLVDHLANVAQVVRRIEPEDYVPGPKREGLIHQVVILKRAVPADAEVVNGHAGHAAELIGPRIFRLHVHAVCVRVTQRDYIGPLGDRRVPEPVVVDILERGIDPAAELLVVDLAVFQRVYNECGENPQPDLENSQRNNDGTYDKGGFSEVHRPGL